MDTVGFTGQLNAAPCECQRRQAEARRQVAGGGPEVRQAESMREYQQRAASAVGANADGASGFGSRYDGGPQAGALHTMAGAVGGASKDKPLADALCAILSGFAGERGDSEGAVECLDRLLLEVRAARQGPAATQPPTIPDASGNPPEDA